MNRNTLDPLTYGRDRVSRSYYDYGRFCAAHPVGCIAVCILTMIVLSYPALARVKLPISSPMDIYWTQELQPDISKNNTAVPEWLLLQSALYFQQIIVKAHVEPWHSHNMTPVMAIKGPLSRAFNVMEHLEKVKIPSSKGETVNLNSLCFHLPSSPDIFFRNLLPTYGCLLLSPTMFWGKNKDQFLRDENVVSTIFNPICVPSMCPRDILIGAPTRLSKINLLNTWCSTDNLIKNTRENYVLGGIKQTFQTNRRRSIEFAITVIQSKYDANFRNALVSSLASEFKIVDSMASDESTYVYVFYRPRKYFTDYFPLFASYLLCMIYFYYTVSKFEMVKSKWGLAFAAFNTVFWTLTITSSICAYFELISTLWGAGLYPYLAMIIGLENILCITRAVVYTNPNMDVAARLSHGLSHEGYSITKFFLMEMTFLGIGYITFVSEIQEFCTFAFIALVVDFYMQLFFYTPCLIFDLQRLGDAEKEKFSQMLFKSDIRKLKNYPMPKCPARIILPWMFSRKEKIIRTQSEINLINKNSNEKFHRRTLSTDKAAQIGKNDTPISYRLRVLYFWTRTRFVQRGVMIFFAIWVLWLAFIVHRWKLWDAAISLSKNASSAYGFGVSHHILDTAPLQWVHWQRQTFKWWPALFGEYNMSLSGHYITFLPPIVLQTIIPPNDSSLKFYGEPGAKNIAGLRDSADPTKHPELQNRITFLERQMTAVLVTSMFLPFCFVVAFILYICFWDRWRQYRSASRKSEDVQTLPKTHLSHNFVELTPLLFSNHEIVIECAAVQQPSTVIFTSLDSRVYICGTYNGEAKTQLARWQPHVERDGIRHRLRTDTEHSVSEKTPSQIPVTVGSGNASVAMLQTGIGFNRAQIWAVDVRQGIIALGCSDGSIEVGNTAFARVLGRYQNNNDAGVVQIKLKANKVIVGRLNGLLELVGLQFTESADHPLRFTSLATVKAHQRPCTGLVCTGLYLFSSGYDRLVKIFDIRTMRPLHTLIRDESPVLELKIDEQVDSPLVLYNRYESGLICSWDVESGEYLHSFTDLQSNGITRAEMALTSTALVAFSEDGQLFIWNKFSSDFIIRLVAEETFINETTFFELTRGRILSLGDNNTVVTSIGTCVQFWDVEFKALIRQVELPTSIETLLIIEGKAILCVSTNTIYRIDLPIGSLRNRIAQ